ncbi:hypothetical protein [Tateyamaria sp.]|uniref:hypothetical protein n=1 Tax=Tateyamaria sp. TaxID=1929288 RepID=UPI003B20E1DD
MYGVLWWVLIAAASIIPMFKLLPHFGFHKYYAVFCILPVGTIILLWLMAMKLQEMEQR